MLEKTIKLLEELRSGKYIYVSYGQKRIIAEYQESIKNLDEKDYSIFLKQIPHPERWIIERKNKKVSYRIIEAIIFGVCNGRNFRPYEEYKNTIMELAKKNKNRYIDFIKSVIRIGAKLNTDISDIEDFIIHRYLNKNKNKINYMHLIDLTDGLDINVRRILKHLIVSKPFRSDELIIKYFIKRNKDRLENLTLLI